jgi:hypothetical protein
MHPVVIAVYSRSNTQQHRDSHPRAAALRGTAPQVLAQTARSVLDRKRKISGSTESILLVRRGGRTSRFCTGAFRQARLHCRWNAGSASSPSAPFVGVRSPALKTSSRKSTLSCSITTVRVGLSSGPRRPIRSCRRSPDFVRIFQGHHTSSLRKIASPRRRNGCNPT